MEITISHLSGSRAGETQTFSQNASIRIGRNPDTDVTFDPYQDRLVSAFHAEITSTAGGWSIRDHNSSNGTFIGGERIKEKLLRPGDVIELGKNGPRIRVHFNAPAQQVPGTIVDQHLGAAPVGGTVVMALNADPASVSDGLMGFPAPAPPRPVRRKSPLRALAITAGVLFVLLALGVVGAVMLRRANVRKHRAAAAAKLQQTSSLAEQQDAVRAEQLKNQAAQQSAAVAQKEAEYHQAVNAAGTNAVSAEELADLKRQLDESRTSEAELVRQLQETNDRLEAARSKPADVRYKYVPIPSPAPASTPAASAPAPAPQRPAPAPESAYAPATQSPASVAGESGVRPLTTAREPERVAEAVAAPATRRKTEPRASAVERRAAAAETPPVIAPSVPAFPGKLLKRKIAISAMPPAVPLANLPSGASRDLANTLAAALESTGNFVTDAKAAATPSLALSVTNFQSEANVTDAKKAVSTASKLGRIFGTNVPKTHIEKARTASYEAAMSLKVELFDVAGRPLAAAHSESQAANRKNSFTVAGVPFSQAVLADTALGDVSRKVIADAMEDLTPALSKLEWSAALLSQRNDVAVVGAGRNSGLEVGDVLETIDSYGRVNGRLRVAAISFETAEADILSITDKKLGTRIRFVGSEKPPATITADSRWFVTNKKTSVFDGPGNSYPQLRTVNPGARFRLDYVIGAWARVTDSGNRIWVPMTAGTMVTD